ncbi:zinc carboxypeptidase [Microdochium trichocladiopsis]|uniref:Zinc carboxypeptidase n=1 Tax=Microdochium trichocladiopsis TaxID=1682393 RepID=A0A9P8XRV3_9PEZI|nr:zinc carboxypeptidase [Microdochium trichocladiopsis]KAH7014258.1 zinc carboxypeptidase [Microdochium trichocladiopsis]
MRTSTFTALLTSLALAVTAAPATAAADEQPVSYTGYQVFRVKTHGRAAEVQDKLSSLNYDEWHHDFQTVDVVVGPSEVDAFKALQLDYVVMHEDLGSSIDAEAVTTSQWKSKSKRQLDDDSWFDAYHNYEDHIQYFRSLQSAFANNSELVSSGKSYQGRDIYGLHLWGAGGPGKPAVLYHGTVHAREWIAAPVVEYITQQLIKNYIAGDREVTSTLDKYDFYIFPFVNPDGFVYSQVADRLWRKNRQPPPTSAPNQTCLGRDINRNWEFGWDSNPLGASTNPCSQTYKGVAPADTPENKGLDTFVRKIRDAQGIKLFIDWHSYGQYILSPFGYKETLYAPELGKWTKAAAMVSEAIRDSDRGANGGKTYVFGPSGATLYTTTGAAPDHVYATGRAEFSYTIELRDTGNFGFVLPATEIRPTARENWAGQKVLWSLLDEVFFDGQGPAMYQAAI